jgi:hypothetical protein
MFNPGDVVRIFRHDGIWVVERQEPDGRWRVCSCSTEYRQRGSYTSRTVGEGAMVLIAPAPTYEAGSVVQYRGVALKVLEDTGPLVRFSVAAKAQPLRGTGAVHVPSGNGAIISKSDLVLHSLEY